MSRCSDRMGVVLFNLILVVSTLPTFMAALFWSYVICCIPAACRDRCEKILASLTITAVSLCWRFTLAVCPWISITTDGVHEMRAGLTRSVGRPRVILANHQCFLDTLLSVAILPFWQVGQVKMMVSSHLFKMPILGFLVRAMGHLCIPFTSMGADDFTVDKDAAEATMQRLEDWVKAGYIGGWFPEGRMNPGDPAQLSTFRAGGFGLASRNDVEVWLGVFVGNADCWPREAPLGGRPSQIHIRTVRVCESTFALLEDAELGENVADERQRCIFLANHVQEICQREMDNILQDEFGSEHTGSKQLC